MTTKTETNSLPRWDLKDLLDGLDDPRIELTLKETPEKAAAFESKYKGKLAQLSPEGLLEAIQTLESIKTPFWQLSQYASLRNATDTSDEAIKSLVDRIDGVGAQISNHLVFFGLEIGAMSATDFAKWDGQDVLKDFSYPLQHIRHKARYHLSENEEQMVNMKDLTGVDAFQKLYEEFTSAFEFEFEVDGELKKMNGSELRALRQDKDPKVRRAAMKLFYSKYEEQEIVFTQTFNAIVKDFNLERQKRGYESSISVMNEGNDLSDKAVQTLHDVTTESYKLVNRYYKIKKQILGLDELTLADIYAPMPKAETKIEWDSSVQLVLDSFQAFDSEFHGMAKQMFDEDRVDAPTGKRKRGGAFCSSSTPDKAPYVLLNFMGRQRDVSTMAHELGHAIHAMLSTDLPLWTNHAILPLCETASVFCEMILTDHMKKQITDPKEKRALITDKLEDLFATSHRQNMFSRFEMAAHAQMSESRMGTEELCDLYTSELKKMFGDAVTYTPEYRWEWATIPHIYQVPFYVYAYNFGNLLVIALYQQYLEEGESFIPKLKKMLAMGSSASPKEITEAIGVDIESPEFWRKSLTYIEGMINELETLV
ncbi:M3 family oligoendopeptidase [bacterium]|jgi:oligoendopeptidase F|nr:M3 family oligoendopeptidase [bacterium]